MQNLKPLSNNVFIEPTEEEKTTESGIVIPETADRDEPARGKVVAVGPGKRDEKGEIVPMSVKVGDTVMFKKYSKSEVEVNDKEYWVVGEEDILAVIE